MGNQKQHGLHVTSQSSWQRAFSWVFIAHKTDIPASVKHVRKLTEEGREHKRSIWRVIISPFPKSSAHWSEWNGGLYYRSLSPRRGEERLYLLFLETCRVIDFTFHPFGIAQPLSSLYFLTCSQWNWTHSGIVISRLAFLFMMDSS